MGRKRKNKKKVSNDFKGVLLIIIAIILFTFLTVKSSGIISGVINSIVFGIFGVSSYIIPIILLLIGIFVIMSENKVNIASQISKALVLVAFISSIFCLFTFKENSLILFSNPIKFITMTLVDAIDGNILYGVLGALIANISVKLMGVLASKIVAIFSTFLLALFIFNISIRQCFYFIYNIFAFIVNSLYSVFQTLFRKDDDIDMENIDAFKSRRKNIEEKRQNRHERRSNKQAEIDNILKVNALEQVEIDFDKIEEDKNLSENDAKASEKRDDFFKKQIEKKEDNNVKEVLTLDHGKLAVDEEYNFPPIDILAENKKSGRNIDKRTIHATAVKLQKTLASFGVDAKVSDFTKGPTVTRYELTPSIGVKVSKIVNLADDIALNLAAKSIRIEAPIPGKAAVGIEVPNLEPEPVFLREVIESKEFKEHKSNVAYALGRDAAGDIVVGDIAKMPHMLIAGSTGSGKSVCINSIIVSLLYKSKPSDVKLILVDPKMVELSCYNGIPHLLIPVVTDPKKAAGALNWAVSEMVNRYNLFASKGTKDIKGYNAIIEKDLNGGVKLPQIVIIIDELADLMMVAPNDVEDAICRLAQMARAAGMHLIIATQRPSVDVITGIIKANIPSRIAFTVSSNVDSRTILDSAGAEKLLGKGDMLYFPVGANKPQRIQGTWVSEQEIDTVVASIKRDDVVVYDDEIIEKIEKTELKGKGNSSTKDPDSIEDAPDEDPLLNDAIDLVIDMGQASASMLQRRFKIGYSRAGRIVDQMEERGLISGYEGSKPRKVLIKKEEWQEIKFQMQQAERKENKEENS